MDKSLVTIVIPTFNRLWGLIEAIKSIQAQSWQKWNIVVIDDAGTDPVDEYLICLNDNRISYFKQPKNVGVAQNWVAGIRKVETRYFSILMDDDWYGPDFLAHRLSVIQSNPDICMVYGPYQRILSNSENAVQVTPKQRGILNPSALTKAMIARDSFIGSTLFRTEDVQNVLDKCVHYSLVIDYAINIFGTLTCRSNGYCLDTFDFFYRDHPDTISNTKRRQVFQESYELLDAIKIIAPQFKESVNHEIFHQSLGASRERFGLSQRMNWACRAVKNNPLSLKGYWNLTKCLMAVH